MGRSLGRVRRDWPNGEQRIRYFLSTFACRLGLYCLMPLAYNQDLPPAGGFETLRYKRSLPYRGPSGIVLLLSTLGICGYGFYRFGQGAIERRELKREKVWSRIHLIPLLEAENDRDEYRRAMGKKAVEGAIMKRHKHWKAGDSVYFYDRNDHERVV